MRGASNSFKKSAAAWCWRNTKCGLKLETESCCSSNWWNLGIPPTWGITNRHATFRMKPRRFEVWGAQTGDSSLPGVPERHWPNPQVNMERRVPTQPAVGTKWVQETSIKVAIWRNKKGIWRQTMTVLWKLSQQTRVQVFLYLFYLQVGNPTAFGPGILQPNAIPTFSHSHLGALLRFRLLRHFIPFGIPQGLGGQASCGSPIFNPHNPWQQQWEAT